MNIETFTFRSKCLPLKSYNFFKDIKENQDFCDVTFRVGERSIRAHRLVMAAASPYFRESLPSKTSTTEGYVILLPDIEPAAFKSLLDFAYTCEIVITPENVRSLLNGACFLRIDEVRDACCAFLTYQFTPENIFSMRDFANKLKCLELLRYVECYVRENFLKISDSEEFFKLPAAYIKELLASDDLCVNSEEKVFDIAMNWVKKNPEEGKAELPALLKSIRMPLLNPCYIKNHVMKENLIVLSARCMALLDEARDLQAFPGNRPSSCSFSSKPRHSAEDYSVSVSESSSCLYVLYGSHTYTAKYLNCGEDKGWKTERNFAVCPKGSCSVGMNNKFYLFRGCDTMEYYAWNKRYESLQPAPSGRHFCGAAALGNKIYICGGVKGTSPSNKVECYNVQADKWEQINSMHHCRDSPGVVALGKCIYVLGGVSSTAEQNSVEKYDSRMKKWNYVTSMLTKRYALGSAELGGRIYACGGISSQKSIATAEVYDPTEKVWKFISPMNKARRYLKLLTYAGELYAIGGEDERGILNTVEIYNPESNNWRYGKETDSNELICAAGVMSLLKAPHESSEN